jgi:Fungal chitosanase of glycosyl hydrolase group 75
LALCYVAASLRGGTWMIPAFHCVLDQGISDGHDDPQNFDLFQWGGALEKVVNEILRQPHVEAMAEATAEAAAIELETVCSDLSDGRRGIKVKRIKGTSPLFFKAKFAVDADGAARAYHPDDVPEALDLKRNATSGSKKYIQGKKKNGKLGKGPRPGFYVSETSLSRGDAWDADSFVDAEFVPYIVLPAHFASNVAAGNLCTVVSLKNFRATPAIFADSNPHVGEASVRAALNLNVNDPSMPITELAKHGGDVKANYLYIVYPGQKLAARAAVPHWPVEEITQRADELFAQWGGIDMARRVLAAM